MNKVELSFDELALIAGGHSAFQLLWAGVQTGVFDVLARNASLKQGELAAKIGLAPQPAKILLRGLAALRLIRHEQGRYSNCAIAGQLLVSDSPQNLLAVLGWQAHIVYPGQIDFLESLRSNTNVGLRRFPGTENNLYQRLAHDPELEKVFHDAMSSLSRSANSMLAQSVDFSGIKHLVDGGGGDGTNAIALARAHSHLRVTVFDAPSVCERASENFQKAGLADRLTAHPGDLFQTPFPAGIDCILLAHMMTIWSLEKDTTLLKRAFDALPTGGQVIIFNMMASDEEDGPMTAVLGSPYFLTVATGEGMLYTWREYEECLANAGFRRTPRLVLPRDHGVLVGIK